MVAQLVKADGSVQVTRKDNMIVNAGFDFIANSIGATEDRPAVMKGIGVGTGTDSVKETDRALIKPLLYKAATFSHLSSTKVFTFKTRFEAGEATGAITEAAVMTGNGGTLLDRVTFPVINKAADDQLSITFTFTMA